MFRIQLLFSTLTLIVLIELLCSCIRRLLPNRANGVAVFESSIKAASISSFKYVVLLKTTYLHTL